MLYLNAKVIFIGENFDEKKFVQNKSFIKMQCTLSQSSSVLGNRGPSHYAAFALDIDILLLKTKYVIYARLETCFNFMAVTTLVSKPKRRDFL